MIEDLQQAVDCTDFVTRSLQEAIPKASSIEAIILLPIVADAARLQARIKQLLDAAAEARGQ